MAIEFFCPGCGKLMRTPDETAGRKGRCPSCSLKVQIPLTSVASNSSSSPVIKLGETPRVSPQTTVRLTPNIEFACQSCGKELSVPAASAGKKGKCPHCSAVMTIPERSVPVETKSAAPSQPAGRWRGTPQPKPKPVAAVKKSPPASAPSPAPQAGAKIEFSCERCGRVVRVAAAAAGQKGQCPQCKSVMMIPHNSTVSQPGLQPLGSGGLQPLDSAGLTPLDGLTPLEGLTPWDSQAPISGLTPLADSGLTPLDNMGLSPLAGFGSPTNTGLGNPFGGPPNLGMASFPATNPYSTPLALPAPRKRPARGERTGTQIATMICGGFITFYAAGQLLIIILNAIFKGAFVMAMVSRANEQELGEDFGRALGFTALGITVVVLSCIWLTMLAGGIQMLRLKTWGLCLAACILAVLPCSCLAIFSIPLGIWGIVMLSLQSVRSAFT